jgi:hypothetical protein
MPSKSDSEIEQWVLRELGSSGKSHSPEICVFASAGVVRLRGSVQSYRNKLTAEEAAYRAPGVLGVVNEIRIEPCAAVIEKVFTSLSLTKFRRQGGLVHRTAIETPVLNASAI